VAGILPAKQAENQPPMVEANTSHIISQLPKMPFARIPWAGSQVALSNVTPAPPSHADGLCYGATVCLDFSGRSSHNSNEGE